MNAFHSLDRVISLECCRYIWRTELVLVSPTLQTDAASERLLKLYGRNVTDYKHVVFAATQNNTIAVGTVAAKTAFKRYF